MARIEGVGPGLPKPGGPYSQSVRIGPIVACAGQGGIDPSTGEVVSEDVGDQTRQALANVQAALAASGASLDDVVKVGVFLADPDDFGTMNQAYAAFFAAPPPARTTVFVRLPGRMKVEIDALAVLPAP